MKVRASVKKKFVISARSYDAVVWFTSFVVNPRHKQRQGLVKESTQYSAGLVDRAMGFIKSLKNDLLSVE